MRGVLRELLRIMRIKVQKYINSFYLAVKTLVRNILDGAKTGVNAVAR